MNSLIKRFKRNGHGDVDAVEIETKNGPINVNFPSHMAKAVMKTTAIGQQVIADYIEKTEPEKKSKCELKAIKEDKQAEALTIKSNKPKKPSENSWVGTIKPKKFMLVRNK